MDFQEGEFKEKENPESTDQKKEKEAEQNKGWSHPHPHHSHHHHRHGGCCNGHRGGFNPGKLFFGLFLIGLGLLYLAKNLGFLPASFNIEWEKLWPLLIIFLGLSFFTGRNWASIIIVILFTIIIIGLVAALIAGGVFHAVPMPMWGRGYSY
ncbi:MAG: DUF5668 domain-containing protein [Patescibacteria group bacterium]|jgi:hypothetical protein